jgi:hypothetical protein
MTLLIALLLLLATGLLAARYGVDSTPTLRSPEEELAQVGVTWMPDHEA